MRWRFAAADLVQGHGWSEYVLETEAPAWDMYYTSESFFGRGCEAVFKLDTAGPSFLLIKFS